MITTTTRPAFTVTKRVDYGPREHGLRGLCDSTWMSDEDAADRLADATPGAYKPLRVGPSLYRVDVPVRDATNK